MTEKTKKKHISDKKHALHPSTALEEFRGTKGKQQVEPSNDDSTFAMPQETI